MVLANENLRLKLQMLNLFSYVWKSSPIYVFNFYLSRLNLSSESIILWLKIHTTVDVDIRCMPLFARENSLLIRSFNSLLIRVRIQYTFYTFTAIICKMTCELLGLTDSQGKYDNDLQINGLIWRTMDSLWHMAWPVRSTI